MMNTVFVWDEYYKPFVSYQVVKMTFIYYTVYGQKNNQKSWYLKSLTF